MKFPFQTDKLGVDPAVLLKRLRLEMARPIDAGSGATASTPVQGSVLPPDPSPPEQTWRSNGGGLLRKALRWAKSLLLLQSTRFKVHMLEQAHNDLRTQLVGGGGTPVAVRNDVRRCLQELEFLQQEISASRQRQDLLAMDMALQQSRLDRALTRLNAAPRASLSSPADGPVDLGALYLSCEEVFRGSREDIKERVKRHVEKFTQAGAGRPDRPILDLGCGRGEWLEVLREHGLAARGIDLNPCNVDLCRRRELSVEENDALAALKACPDGSLGGVSAFYLVEHLCFEVMVATIDESLRALAPGGILLLETTNPECLMVHGRDFSFDPKRRHLIPPQALSFVLERRGFAAVEVVRLHPYGQEHHLDASQGQAEALLNELLFGPKDYAVIGRKP